MKPSDTKVPNFSHPILQLLQQCKTLDSLKQAHAQMITTGLILHTYPLSRMLLLSSTLATSLSYALAIFNQVPNPTVFLFNTLISSSLTPKLRHTHVALSLYSRILTHTSLKPNNYTYPSLFKACGCHPWHQHGLALHTHVLKFLEPTSYDNFVQASLLNFYSKCGKVGVCRYLFDQISKPDLGCWNSILSAYAQNASSLKGVSSHNVDDINLSLEVLFLFSDMQRSLLRPNEVTLVALISACADLGALSQAQAYNPVTSPDSKSSRLNDWVCPLQGDLKVLAATNRGQAQALFSSCWPYTMALT
ncbi:hypothetical protein RJ639_001342 [Escallonia herrerae]|uniref:Pentatricopeptide repeat-containing protein n=1 Tax=Escallonia herrerae TaxID=1293975 RepID=A0AA88X946_9ASTE|nr:hypothetical protein RJ639_001342 [Escallonia herrerae]